MKKIYFIAIILFSFLLLGCEESKKIKLVATIGVEENGILEVTYEWYEEEPNKMIKKTSIYTYEFSNYIHDSKVIECENYKKKGSLFYCEVNRENGKVIYKVIDDNDIEMTYDTIKTTLINSGYTIKQ